MLYLVTKDFDLINNCVTTNATVGKKKFRSLFVITHCNENNNKKTKYGSPFDDRNDTFKLRDDLSLAILATVKHLLMMN